MITDIVVPGEGNKPCRWMIVGERPGADEAREGGPFRGRSGEEQDLFLRLSGFHRRMFYITNLVKSYDNENADPTRTDIQAWEDALYRELQEVRPEFVLSVGRFATRWFLGEVDMDSVHGTPHRPRAEVAAFCGHIGLPIPTVVPCYHPAFGLYDPDAKGLVYHDYQQAALIIRGRISREPVVDDVAHPSYLEIDDPRRIKAELEGMPRVAIDTEGYVSNPWSFQFSSNPGTGIVVRTASRWFGDCVRVFAEYIRRENPLVIVHNTMYDLEMMRVMGADLGGARLYDTMVAAYLLRLLPQSLKHLAIRLCGMQMVEYGELLADAADRKQEDYLFAVLDKEWPKPEPRVIVENDLTARVYKPQPIAQRVEKILLDWDTAKENVVLLGRKVVKPDAKEEFDAAKRWRGMDDVLRAQVEAVLGPFPIPTLDDVPLDRAITYAGRDPDATLRVHSRIAPMVETAGLDDRMALIMANLPTIEEMQSTGLLASRPHFQALRERMQDKMEAICSRISAKYNGGQPFNPGSPDQVARVMLERGIEGMKTSRKTGKVSTNKKSIEHLRFEDAFIGDVEDWREHQKIRDSFADPILDRIPEGVDVAPIRCNIRVTRVSSSRLSATDPPLLAIPVRHQLGLDVRRGFVAPDGNYLGTWDLSQIEMRVMAHLSKDPFLCQLFHENRDIHAETAIRIFGLDPRREWVVGKSGKGEWKYPGVDKMKHRNPTKRAGFGVITGIQGPGLLDQLRQMGCEGWDVDSCDQLIEDWFKVYPGVDTFLTACRNACRDKGYVRDMGGMYRYLPGIWSRDNRVAAEAGRQSHSHIIQGSAQWMIQRAMAWARPQINALRSATGWYIRWLLQIHDELIFTFPQVAWDVMNALVMEALTEHSYRLSVPVEANGAFGLTWGDLEK
jgi:uracil-DNA glycosylase family 4